MGYKEKYIKYKKKYYQTKQSGGAKDDCEDTINELKTFLLMNKEKNFTDEETIELIIKKLDKYDKHILQNNNHSNESKGESKEKSKTERNTEKDTNKDYTFHDNILRQSFSNRLGFKIEGFSSNRGPVSVCIRVRVT